MADGVGTGSKLGPVTQLRWAGDEAVRGLRGWYGAGFAVTGMRRQLSAKFRKTMPAWLRITMFRYNAVRVP